MARQAPERPLDDPAKSDRVDKVRYKAEQGKQDIILILYRPRYTPKHYTGRFYLQCLQGDNPPCCAQLGRAMPSNTTYIIHVAERMGEGKWKTVGEPKVWGFGEDKWVQVQTLLRDYCDGDFEKMRQLKISVTCQDKKKQKLFLSAYPKDDVKVTREMMVKAKEHKAMFEDDIAIDEGDILQDLKRLAEGRSGRSSREDVSDEPEEPEEASEPIGDLDGEIESMIEGFDGGEEL